MKTLTAAVLLIPSTASAAAPQSYLRRTRAETRTGRLSGFTWINVEEAVGDAATSSTEATGTAMADVEVATMPTTSTESNQLAETTEFATLPTTTSDGSTADVSTATNLETATPASYTWAATCTTSAECYPKLRVELPSSEDPIGVGICGCYANSISAPLDECQQEQECAIAGCFHNSCDGTIAVCEEGVCILQMSEIEAKLNWDVAGVQPDMPMWCNNDSDCLNNDVCIDESNGMCFSPPCGRCMPNLEGEIEEIESLNSMSMIEVSLDENDFDFTEDEVMRCDSHEDCVQMNGCCLGDSVCHIKTEEMPICWSV